MSPVTDLVNPVTDLVGPVTDLVNPCTRPGKLVTDLVSSVTSGPCDRPGGLCD